MTTFDASVWGESRGGHSRPSGQHDLSSDRSSAGRLAFTRSSSARNETSGKSAPVQPEGTATNEVEDQVRGGDRRIARRQSRGTRVTVRLSDEESAQLARVAGRYGGVYATHMRNEGDKVADAIRESIAIGEQAVGRRPF